MLRSFLIGVLVGILLVMAGVYFYFSTGSAPVAVTAPPMPFERKFAHMGLDAYLAKLPHPQPQVPEDETNFLAGAQVYKENCAVCHALPDGKKSNISAGMAPGPPLLLRGTGVTDDEPWETYWKVENGIRMTGMPGFKNKLNETQIWQVTVMVKNADKLSGAVKAALQSDVAPDPAATPNPANPATLPPPTQH
jgi:thiosulfate dehydrogenase